MDVRGFDGVDDQIILASGGVGALLASGGPGFSILIVFRPLAFSSDSCAISMSSSVSTVTMCGFYFNNGGGIRWGSDTPAADVAPSPDIGLTNNTWQIMAVTKAGGTTTPRFHLRSSGGSWTHRDGASTIGSTANTVNNFKIATFGTNDGDSEQRVAVAAAFASVLSDGDMETISNATTQIAALSPVALWEFNQASIATTVDDLIGTADQSGITGTTVVSSDVDLTWTFGLAAAASPGPADTFSPIPFMKGPQ